MLLAVAAACGSETVEVPGETVVVEKEVIKTVEVPGETVVKEVVKEVQVPGETVVVKEEVVKEVMVPGETVVVEKVVTETVEVPGETVTVEVVKEVQVPGETVVVEKVVTQTIEVPGETVVVEKVVTQTVEVPGETVVVEKEVVKTVEVPGPERVVVKEVEVIGDRYTRDVRGQLVEKPQYGGTIPIARASILEEWDPWFMGWPALTLETMGIQDWTVPREEYGFQASFVPTDYIRGHLAESWEQPDPLTYIFHIRQGVYWHDKPPMNGREFNAYDVEYTLHRMFGFSEKYGFTEPSVNPITGLPVESVTATDKWTVVVKTSSFDFTTLPHLLLMQAGSPNYIQPREVIEQYGDMQDWRNVVGTGPYELTDYVEGSSVTYTKYPNYWGYDENHPENRLPYTDEVRQLNMPDFSTRLAALRTGKSVLLYEVGVSIDVVESIQRTNPELIFSTAEWYTAGIGFGVHEPPFSDRNVRIAMQKALDLETINETYYKGYGDVTPYGTAGPGLGKGFYIPYDEWPEELQGYFTYDPEEAEALLDAAGYPRLEDGIRFKTGYDITTDWGQDPDLAQILKVYWAEIGVDVELNVMDGGLLWERMTNLAYEGMTYGEFYRMSLGYPEVRLGFVAHSDANWNTYGINDPKMDALMEKAEGATDWEDYQQWNIDLDMYHISQQWGIMLPNTGMFVFNQPWFIGFSGEYWGHANIFARTWIDQELKEEMGH